MYRSWPGSRVAAVGLVLANVVPLVGVLRFGWDLHSLLVVYWLESGVVAVAAVGLAAYHVVPYRANYIAGGEYGRSGPVTLTFEPYRRVFVLHLTIVVGGFAVAPFGAPVGALAVMVLAKTALDVRGHWKEHERARRRPPPGTTVE